METFNEFVNSIPLEKHGYKYVMARKTWNHQQSKISKLIKALEFYADKKSWQTDGEYDFNDVICHQDRRADNEKSPWDEDWYGGKTAIKALKEFK